MAGHDNSSNGSVEHQHDVPAIPEALQNNIPIIDFAGIDGPERPKISQQIAEACETWGFFHIINHGVDRSLIKRTKDVSTEFFHSPEEEKLKIKAQGPLNDGWNHSKNATGETGCNNLVQKDTVEHLYIAYYPERKANFDRCPQHPASYRPTLMEYTKEIQLLCKKLLVVLSEMLGLAPESLMSALVAGSASQTLHISMRSNFYGLNDDGEAFPNVCHAHSDPGALSVLLADDVPGLEVKKDGRWVKVDPIPGGLIVNVGDILEICSNGRFKSSEHRGIPSHKQERLSLATFEGPELDAVVGPIGSLVDESHPPLYKTSTFGEYFAAFMKGGLQGKRGLERHKL